LLEANGLWDEIEPRLVYGENAMQVLQFVKAGAVDFGFVPLTLLVDGVDGVERMVHDLPTAIPNGLLSNTAAVVSASPREREARLFLAFLGGAEARAAIDRSGLCLVEHPGVRKGA
jgi:molybdate transport system substrate-binding protein